MPCSRAGTDDAAAPGMPDQLELEAEALNAESIQSMRAPHSLVSAPRGSTSALNQHFKPPSAGCICIITPNRVQTAPFRHFTACPGAPTERPLQFVGDPETVLSIAKAPEEAFKRIQHRICAGCVALPSEAADLHSVRSGPLTAGGLSC